MFAFKPRMEIATRILAIAVVLFNALAPTPTLAKAADIPESKHEPIWVSAPQPKVERLERPRGIEKNNSRQAANCEVDANNDLIVLTGTTCYLEPGTHIFRNITVQPGSTLTLEGDPDTETGGILQAESVTVEGYYDEQGTSHTGLIQADGQGYPGGMGPGKGANGTDADHFAGGGGYGGEGGTGKGGIAGGNGYGSVYAPTMFGSGGGNMGSASGGEGGGAIKIITNSLTLNGIISANGNPGIADWQDNWAGGGSGGSIWIVADSFTGSGSIESIGLTDPNSLAGGGSGGRVVIDVPVTGNSFSGGIDVYGGLIGNPWYDRVRVGGPGTTYWVKEDKLIADQGQGFSEHFAVLLPGDYDFDIIDMRYETKLKILGTTSSLTVNNDTFVVDFNYYASGYLVVEGILHAPADFVVQDVLLAPLSGLEGPQNITAQSNGGLELHAELRPNGVYTFGDVTIANSGMLRLASFHNDDLDFTNDYGVTLQVENLTVDGEIEANGLGYPGGMGPGKGTDAADANHLAGGGGYAGEGADSIDGTAGGNGYGNIFTPAMLGSGGGNITSGPGGPGGGAIKLAVTNHLTLNGMISASGADDSSDGGGGSGGSIWIQANSFAGSGGIYAYGGYSSGDSGGGAGGRIAIDVPSGENTYTGGTYAWGDGDSDFSYAASGTVYWTTENKLMVDGEWDDGEIRKKTVLIEDDYEFDTIEINGLAKVRILGANSSLTLNSDTVMLSDTAYGIDSYYYIYGKLEVEGVVHAPETLEIKKIMLAPLQGLEANVQNISITNRGGLELHADVSPEPNGVYQFNNITVGDGASWMDTLRLVSFKNDNENYADDYGVTLRANNITVNNGGVIDAYGQGYPAGVGPGKGMDGTSYASGAGHGGEGGNSIAGQKGGATYDNLYAPTMLGSGGGNVAGGHGGGAGGGAIKLEVDTLMINEGYIIANAEELERGNSAPQGGGGAGGSIWIVANLITSSDEAGWGEIYAAGANGNWEDNNGGGGGGRVVIDAAEVSNFKYGLYAGAYEGGHINLAGASGTAYWVKEDKLVVDDSDNPYTSAKTILPEDNYEFDTIDLYSARVRIAGENSSLTVGNTTFIDNGKGRVEVEGTIIAPTDFTFDGDTTLVVLNGLQGAENITLQDGGSLELFAGARPGGVFSFGNITVANGGRLRLAPFNNGDASLTDDYGVTLQVNNLTVDLGGVVEADGRGYPAASGPGKGANGSGARYQQGGGGGYGGAGGNGDGGNLGGPSYGSEYIYTPTLLGSGGGNTTTGAIGGAGGGAFKLEVAGTLSLNGTISANGQNGNNNSHGGHGISGAGSGGSIWIVAPQMTGSGQIQANGGTGLEYKVCVLWWTSDWSCAQYEYHGYSGGGGGGRIAVDTDSLDPGIILSAKGGLAGYWNPGENGTVFDGFADPARSTVVITVPPGGVVADGGAAAILTITIVDANGIPIVNEPVEIARELGAGLNILNIGPLNANYVLIGHTNQNGVVTAALTTTGAGLRIIKARVGQIQLVAKGTVEFVAGEISIRDSYVSISTTTAPANGQTPVNVVLMAHDAFGNPIRNAAVTLTTTGEHAVVTLLSPLPITDELGEVHWEIKDASVEAVDVTVTVNEYTMPARSIAFKGADVSVSLAAPPEAPVNRNAEIPYIVTVRNANYLAAPDTVVTITLPAGVSCIDDTLENVNLCEAGQVLPWNVGTLDPGDELSFTLYVRIGSSWEIGQALETTAVAAATVADDDETNNSFTATTMMVSGYKFQVTQSPVSQTVAIGGTATFVIEAENTGLLADEYAVTVTGPEGALYTLSETSFGLLPQEKHQITFSTQYDAETCGEQESHQFDFTINVTAKSETGTKPYYATAIFQASPTISDLEPKPGSVIGSRDVTFSWRTNIPTTGVLTVVGGPNGPQTYGPTPEGTSHSVLVQGLGTIPYEWYVTATSSCGGSATTITQSLSVETGVVFKQHQQSYRINRDYDQFASVVVRNQSNEVRQVQLSIEDPYEDLIVNFRGEGGVDGAITLLPNEERVIQLAIFAQDATLENYSFNALLTSTDGVDTITDVATVNVHVLFPNNYTVEEKGTDPLSGATIYRVTNRGLPITDLNIHAVLAGTDLPAPVYITPQIVHARLGINDWLEFRVLPLYSAENVTPVEGHSSGKMLSGIRRVNEPDVEIVSTVAKITKRHLLPKNCDAQIYAVTFHNVLLPIPFTAWYCTNKEDIDIELEVPPFVNPRHILGSTLEMGFSPVSAMRPHDTFIYFNGNEIANMPNQVPNGQLRFDVDPSYIRTNPFTSAKQTIHLHSVHNNIGKDEPHHSSQIGGTLYIALEEVTVYVCASSPEEALALARSGYGFIQLPGSFWVNILEPSPDPAGMVWPNEKGTVNIQAHVGNTTTSYPNIYQVEANVEYLDVPASEKILLYDDGLSEHADPTEGDGFFNATWMPKYGGNIRLTVNATLPDGRVETDVRSFRINGQPDLAVTKVYIEEVALLNNRARVRAQIANLGFAITGPVNVDFVYYRTNADGNKIGDPIYTSHLRILLDEFGLPMTMYRNQYIDIQDTGFLPDELYLYFVEVIVDP